MFGGQYIILDVTSILEGKWRDAITVFFGPISDLQLKIKKKKNAYEIEW